MNNAMNMFMQMLMSGNSPQAMLQNMASKNPQIQTVMNQIRQSGLSPKEYLKQYATQNNIDLGPFMNALNSRGIKL